ncbi:MAG: hypothetical protein MUE40_15575 [Anaerolineae bacterium]|jgi:O-antigen/teichoic acid export membrane protein|nr:hypothetical protein [Anaerolineae bacterium]
MDNVDLLSILGLVIFGLVFGVLTARSSNKREKLRGGAVARFFHFSACALMAALTPAVLVMAVFMHPEWVTIGGISIAPIVQMLGIAVALAALAVLLLIPYALLEQPARAAWEQQQIDQGWTEKDARTSGL